MVDLEILKSKGISTEEWKKKLDTEDIKDKKLKEFVDRMWNRAQNGVEESTSDYKTYLAIDSVWDTPFKQISPTLLQTVSQRLAAWKDADMDKINSMVEEFGFRSFLYTDTDPKTGKRVRNLDVPAFTEIIVGVVRSYLTIRWAKLDNDRRMIPGLKYEPTHSTPESRAKCEILTDRIQVMFDQLGYDEVRRQGILKMLLYGVQLKFIEQEWFTEYQWKSVDGQQKKEVVKEGLTYFYPHPTRAYWDAVYPVTSLLTDTGCTYAGYWRIVRYGDIADDPRYWNRDIIAIGRDWIGYLPAYFSTLYSCSLKFPDSATTRTTSNDAQSAIDNPVYNNDLKDSACMVLNHFAKFTPKDVGLGDYDCPIWARFVFAGDGTVIYAAPLPDTPVTTFADCYDSGRKRNASFALELIPFQDAVTNALTQAVLSAKQNLSSAVWVDEDIVSEKTIKSLEEPSGWFYKVRKFIRFNGRKLRASQKSPSDGVVPVSLPLMDVNSSITILNTILNLLERMAQISAVEVGAAGAHEQTAEEIQGIRESTANRLMFTASPIDDEAKAWKRQLYSYLMAYGEPEIWASIPAESRVTPETLAKIGFTVESHEPDETGRLYAKGKKTALTLESFASTREGSQRQQSVEVAGAMSQVVYAIVGNPALLQTIGPEQAVELMNQVLRTMGMPRDFKLRSVGQPMEQQQAEIVQFAEQMKQALGQVQEQNVQMLKQAVEPIIAKIKEIDQLTGANSQAISKLTEIIESIAQESIAQQPQQQPINAQPPEIAAAGPGIGVGIPPAPGMVPQGPGGSVPGMLPI